MPKSKESPSYFHKINNDLTVNLAEVAAVQDMTAYYQQNADNRLIAPLLQSGQTCRVTLLRYQSPMGYAEGGREFDITRDEMTKLQDALDWYNKVSSVEESGSRLSSQLQAIGYELEGFRRMDETLPDAVRRLRQRAESK